MPQKQVISYIDQNKINPKRLEPYFKPDYQKDFDSLHLRLILTGKRTVLCALIRRARIIKGISQSDLAFCMGVNQNYISRVESGKINISINNLLMMIYYLDCHIQIFDDAPKLPKKK